MSIFTSWKKTSLLLLFTSFQYRKVIKSHIKDYFKINGKQIIKIPKKEEYVRFKNYKRKIKSPNIIDPDFEIILVPENNAKQNPREF